MHVYRIASIRYASNNSDGARLYGGRWNEPGTPVIYSSASPSLAALEVLVHFQMIPADYRVINIALPDNLEIETVEIASLPSDWHEALAAGSSAYADSGNRFEYRLTKVTWPFFETLLNKAGCKIQLLRHV